MSASFLFLFRNFQFRSSLSVGRVPNKLRSARTSCSFRYCTSCGQPLHMVHIATSSSVSRDADRPSVTRSKYRTSSEQKTHSYLLHAHVRSERVSAARPLQPIVLGERRSFIQLTCRDRSFLGLESPPKLRLTLFVCGERRRQVLKIVMLPDRFCRLLLRVLVSFGLGLSPAGL